MGVEAVNSTNKSQEANADTLFRKTRQSPYKDIFEAIQNGDLNAVKSFVENQNVDVNSRAPGNTSTIVGSAAGAGYQNIVEYLVNRGADVNATDKFGYNALLWALDKDVANLDLIKYLVANGADVNVTASSTRYTPLHWAAAHNKLDIVEYLLENNANVNADTKDGETPYTLARANGHTQLATRLTNDKQIRFNGDIFAAAKSGNIGLVLHMVENERIQPFAKNADGETALHIAAANGKLPVVKYFLDQRNGSVNVKNENGETPLVVACASGQLDIVKYLIEIKFANPESVDKLGYTPLLMAAKNGRLDVVQYLIENANVDTNAKENESNNVLLVAVENNRMNVVKYLVDQRRLSIYAKNNKGETVLHEAARNGYLDIVKYFVDEKGMEITMVANDGRNVLHKASESNNVNTLKYLIDERGADLNTKDRNQNTILHIAVEKDRLDLVRYLVDRKRMDALVKNVDGRSSVSLADALSRKAIYQYFTKEKGITERPTTTTLRPRPTVRTTTVSREPSSSNPNPNISRTYIFNGEIVDLATRDRLVRELLPTITALSTKEQSFTQNGRTTVEYFVNGMRFDLRTRNKIINDYKKADVGRFQNMKYYVNGQEVNENTRNHFLNGLTGSPDQQNTQYTVVNETPAGVTQFLNGQQLFNQGTFSNGVQADRQVNQHQGGMTYFWNGQVVDEATYLRNTAGQQGNLVQPNFVHAGNGFPNWGRRRKRNSDDDRLETVPATPRSWLIQGRNSNAGLGLLPSVEEGQGNHFTVNHSPADSSTAVQGLLTLIDVGTRHLTSNRYKQHYKHESLLSPRELIENRIDYDAIEATRHFKGGTSE